ncbi:TetR/AcrR family transcriptional regulator [Bacillus carboniphilus]|uniref:TetR/AcrR family transcriptional regulator n=1 Tax=Bacillus carboniphilus TaxID=86663 RepID=A0ABP3G5D6_9BACI
MSPRRGLDIEIILEAATEMADQEGLEAITLATLAKKLNIKPPSLYNHVEGLPGLRKKLAIYGLEQLLEELTKSAVGRSGDDAVRALAISYVSFSRKHPGLYEATLMAPDEDVDHQKAASAIVDLIVNVLRAYELEGEQSLHVVRGLRSILHGFSSLEQKGGFGLPLDLDKSLHLLINTFLAGVHQLVQD